MLTPRIIAFSILGFFAPIVVSLSLSAFLYGHWENKQSLLGDLLPPEPIQNTSLPVEELESDGDKPISSIESRAELDPQSDKLFLVSFSLRLEALPHLNMRQHLIGKYESKAPLQGWAVGLRRLPTSVRAEVYWRGLDGSGGWLPFDEMNITPGEWYSFTMVAKPGAFLNLFYQKLEGEERKVIFVGGHDLTAVSTPQTGASLNLGIKHPKLFKFPGEITDLLVGYPSEVPAGFDKFSPFIEGGPKQIVGRLSEGEVNFWLPREEEARKVVHSSGANSARLS